MTKTITLNIPDIPVSRFVFQFDTVTDLNIPRFPGSAWRGAFGHALKRTVCVVKGIDCQTCLLKTSCAYAYLFETPPPENAVKMRKYNAAPHPFVLQIPEQTTANQHKFSLGMTVFGHGLRYFPYIVHALKKAGLDGIGGKRQVFTLSTITHLSMHEKEKTIYERGSLQPLNHPEKLIIPEMPDKIQLHFLTPLRIKHDGHNLTPRTFNFALFFGNLFRRISMLTYFHSDTPLETDFSGLMALARQTEFSSKKLQWYDWKRYSSRQKTEMNMGGVVGTVSLPMLGLDALWPYLWLGQWTHAGKATSMGMGHYTINVTSLSTQ